MAPPPADDGTAAVVLCADRNIEVGVHVTLRSLLENARCGVRIHFVNKDYGRADLERLHGTLEPFRDRYELLPVRADDSDFGAFASTRGDRVTYLRLRLPELVDEPRVLYLDSDLVVGLDVGEVFRRPLGGHALGASGIGDFEWSNDRALCRRLGLDTGAPYFNAGVLLLDLDAWRRDALSQRCIEFAREHREAIATADQTILNLVFYEDFEALPPECNHLVFPDTPPLPAPEARGRIVHFVGAPKPWDLLGRPLHRNHALFEAVVRRTRMRGRTLARSLTLTQIARAARNCRSYVSLLRSRAR